MNNFLFFVGKFTNCDFDYMAVNPENGRIESIGRCEPRRFCVKTIAHLDSVVYNIDGDSCPVAYIFCALAIWIKIGKFFYRIKLLTLLAK